MQTGVPRGARERNSGEGEVTNHGRSDWALEKMRCDDGGLGGSFGRVNGAKPELAGKPPVETTASLGHGSRVGLTGDDIIRETLEHNRLRNEQLQRYSAVRTYEIRNLDGKRAAEAVVRVDYEAPDKKSFKKSSEKGSGIVRHLVFDRLLRSEGETSSGREHHNSAITPANYTFTLAGEDEIGSYDCPGISKN